MIKFTLSSLKRLVFPKGIAYNHSYMKLTVKLALHSQKSNIYNSVNLPPAFCVASRHTEFFCTSVVLLLWYQYKQAAQREYRPEVQLGYG